MIKNYKTTIIGVVGFILAGCVSQSWITTEQSVTILAAIVGLLGVLAKDNDVTGGTR